MGMFLLCARATRFIADRVPCLFVRFYELGWEVDYISSKDDAAADDSQLYYTRSAAETDLSF